MSDLPAAIAALQRTHPGRDFLLLSATITKEAKELFTNVQSLSAEECAICAMLWKSLGDKSGKLPIFLTYQGELS